MDRECGGRGTVDADEFLVFVACCVDDFSIAFDNDLVKIAVVEERVQRLSLDLVEMGGVVLHGSRRPTCYVDEMRALGGIEVRDDFLAGKLQRVGPKHGIVEKRDGGVGRKIMKCVAGALQVGTEETHIVESVELFDGGVSEMLKSLERVGTQVKRVLAAVFDGDGGVTREGETQDGILVGGNVGVVARIDVV